MINNWEKTLSFHLCKFSLQFIFCYLCSLLPSRLSTTFQFCFVDLSPPPLNNFFLFNTQTWATFLHLFKKALTSQVKFVLCFSPLIGYHRPNTFIILHNLSKAFLNSDISKQKLNKNSFSDRVISYVQIMLFIFSPLGLIFKRNKKFCHVHHFIFLRGLFVTNHIFKQTARLKYVILIFLYKHTGFVAK